MIRSSYNKLQNHVSATTGGGEDDKTCVRIAVIGAGIGGAALCRFLRQTEERYRNIKLIIDVYEASDRTGGRLHAIGVNNHNSNQYEVGGSVIHDRNEYMKEFCAELNLTRVFNGSNDDTLLLAGGVDNSSIILKTTKTRVPFLNTLRMLCRYRFDLVRLYFMLRRELAIFCQIYSKQEQTAACCNNVVELLNLFTSKATTSFNFLHQCCRSLRQQLTLLNFQPKFINEIAQAAARVDYGGQTVDDLHGLCGLISLAGAQDGALWHVLGGNERVVDGLLQKHATRVLLNSPVKSISYSTVSRKFRLALKNSILTEDDAVYYDCVVTACPLLMEQNVIDLLVDAEYDPVPLIDKDFPLHYQHVTTTLISSPPSKPNDKKFHSLPVAETTETIFLTPPLTTLLDSVIGSFNSIAINQPVTRNKSRSWWLKIFAVVFGDSDKENVKEKIVVRKVFSLKEFAVDQYFTADADEKSQCSRRVNWLAYPQYGPIRQWFAEHFSQREAKSEEQLAPQLCFDLSSLLYSSSSSSASSSSNKGLYYISAIEILASAVEMSAIGAKNVALLIERDFFLQIRNKQFTTIHNVKL